MRNIFTIPRGRGGRPDGDDGRRQTTTDGDGRADDDDGWTETTATTTTDGRTETTTTTGRRTGPPHPGRELGARERPDAKRVVNIYAHNLQTA